MFWMRNEQMRDFRVWQCLWRFLRTQKSCPDVDKYILLQNMEGSMKNINISELQKQPLRIPFSLLRWKNIMKFSKTLSFDIDTSAYIISFSPHELDGVYKLFSVPNKVGRVACKKIKIPWHWGLCLYALSHAAPLEYHLHHTRVLVGELKRLCSSNFHQMTGNCMNSSVT